MYNLALIIKQNNLTLCFFQSLSVSVKLLKLLEYSRIAGAEITLHSGLILLIIEMKTSITSRIRQFFPDNSTKSKIKNRVLLVYDIVSSF